MYNIYYIWLSPEALQIFKYLLHTHPNDLPILYIACSSSVSTTAAFHTYVYYVPMNCLHILYFTYRILYANLCVRKAYLFFGGFFQSCLIKLKTYIYSVSEYTQTTNTYLHPPRYCLPQENNINTKGCQISIQYNQIFYNNKGLQFT